MPPTDTQWAEITLLDKQDGKKASSIRFSPTLGRHTLELCNFISSSSPPAKSRDVTVHHIPLPSSRLLKTISQDVDEKVGKEPSVVGHAYSPSPLKVKRGGLLEFEASLGPKVRPHLNNILCPRNATGIIASIVSNTF